MDLTYTNVVLTLLTLGVWAALVGLAFTLIQIRRAARAVEVLAYKVDDSVSRVRTASIKFGSFADSVRSGWMKALEMTLAAFMSMRSDPRRDRDDDIDGRTRPPEEEDVHVRRQPEQ